MLLLLLLVRKSCCWFVLFKSAAAEPQLRLVLFGFGARSGTVTASSGCVSLNPIVLNQISQVKLDQHRVQLDA